MPMKQTLSAVLFVILSSFVFSASAADETKSQVTPSPEQIKQEAQANTKYLAAQALKKAKAVLEAYGEFAPFGAGLFQDGEVNFVWAVKPGESTEGINPVLVLNAVRSALGTQAKSGRILGSAVVYQYRGTSSNGEPREQINIELEYLNGYAEVIATQYEEGPDGIEFTKSTNSQYEPKVFTDESDSGGAE
jgi:hypothetical protein